MVISVFGVQQPETVFKEKHGIWDPTPESTPQSAIHPHCKGKRVRVGKISPVG
jgi:hypothetical protein